jgi:hypothetical protein
VIQEAVDRRVLAALRFVDATVRRPVTDAFEVTGAGVRTIRNRIGLHVIIEAPGFAAYADAFLAPPAVPAAELTLTVRDRSRRYLPRRLTVALPRDSEPGHADQAGSLFRPIDVALFPSPTAIAGVGWAVLRLSIKQTGTSRGLPFAYVRVVRAADDQLLATGLADERGEAMVAVPGVPVTSWSTSATASPTASTVPVRVTAYFARDAFDAATGGYPDPDRLEATFSSLPRSSETSFDLASGREEARRIDVTLPP